MSDKGMISNMGRCSSSTVVRTLMNLYRFFLILFLGSCFASRCISQTATQSVTAWEVKSATNTIYLAGELHSYEAQYTAEVVHTLAEKLVAQSDSIWTENTIQTKKVYPYNLKNSSRISDHTWQEFQKNLRSMVENDVVFPRKSQDERRRLADSLILEMNTAQPFAVFESVIPLAIQINWLNRGYKPKRIPGFILNRLVKLTLVKALEPPESRGDSWTKFCSSDADTEEIFKTLSLLMSKTFTEPIYPSPSETEFFLHLQKMANPENQQMYPWPDMALLLRCDAIPRNRLWLPTILDSLIGDKPAAFFVGIAHLIGEDGIIQMVKKSRPDVTIRRIY